MTELSPAAQAVIDAYVDENCGDDPMPSEIHGIAAAFRAAAEQVDAVSVPDHIRGDAYWPYRNGRAAAKDHLLAIAKELEAQP